jgi:hypothetical protein
MVFDLIQEIGPDGQNSKTYVAHDHQLDADQRGPNLPPVGVLAVLLGVTGAPAWEIESYARNASQS